MYYSSLYINCFVFIAITPVLIVPGVKHSSNVIAEASK